jgi:general secretion pathway protein E/type IV pilus assembly protein PilB
VAANDEYVLDLLINSGLISKTDAAEAQGAASSNGHGAVDHLIENGVISREDLLRYISADCGMDFMPTIDTITDDAIQVLTKEQANRYLAIPVHKEGSYVRIAVADPLDFGTLDALRYILKHDFDPVCVPEDVIRKAIVAYYGSTDESVNALVDSYSDDLELRGGNQPEEPEDPTGGEGDAPIIKMVYGMILDAHRLRGSDIHVEPLEKRLRLRYRIDGVLQEMRDPPKRLQAAIISRIKIMGNMSIAEKRLPQDGRIALHMQDGTHLDLRVSSIPTVHGESIVMRILDKKSLTLGLPELGFLSDDQATMERILGYPDGIFLVTGPTGSGKSTTLYACLNMLNKPDRKLITVEDPVEYVLPGVNQVQVQTDVGMTFANALRSMLRQAPNIIMLGEIRDAETATIAINASLTGHLVFSTLHTNDAPSAVTRLSDIGVKPFLVSSAIRAVLAQRLIRRICQNCVQDYTPTEAELRALNLDQSQIAEAHFRHGHGCDVCRGKGYRGRAGIFELFTVNDDIRNLINSRASVSEIRQRARDLGMRTLREDGIRKVLAGMTTPEEVITATMGDKD